MRHARLMLWAGILAGVSLLAAGPAQAQQKKPAAPAPKPALDGRSVLVAWTNQPADTAAPIAVPTNAPISPEKAIAAEVERGYDQMRMGRLETAIATFNGVLRQDPTNRNARFGIGTVRIQQERYKDALDVLEPMVAEYPQDYFLRNNIAWLYATAKDTSIRDGRKAVKYAQEALLLQPRDYHVWSTLSEGYYVAGQYDRALKAAQEAQNLAQESGGTQENIEEYRRQVEKNTKAVQAMSVIE